MLPIVVNEYSTVMVFDCVTRLSIKPADSRLRRLLEDGAFSYIQTVWGVGYVFVPDEAA